MNGAEILFVPLVTAGRIRLCAETGYVHILQRDGSWRLCKPHRSGYVRLRAKIGGRLRSCAAHRLLWHVAFGPIEPGKQINHKNGIKNENAVSNLELVTPRGNTLHARDELGAFWGAANGNARLQESDVLAIRVRALAGEKLEALASEYGVTAECCRLIKLGRRWRKFLAEVAANEGQEAA